ncbi:MAG TPA: hypothetical protein VNO14_15235 [Blastocatellia bacterium]|nr:hypothetical protein [Blastocatellia bacterium]
MKATAILIILFSLVMPGLAQKSRFVEREGACTEGSHSHRHSDLRIAVVEIRDIDECGFSYVDLEDESAGQDNRMVFAEDFAVAREMTDKKEKDDPLEFRNVLQPKTRLKRGSRGTILYCLPCRTAFVFKPISDEDHR